MTLREINRATLARQMLLARRKTGAIDAVSRLVGLQAQVPRPPFVGLWTRVEGFRRGDLLRALRTRRAVRATAFRATIHLMAAGDYADMRGVLQGGLDAGIRSILRGRLDGFDLDALVLRARAFFGRAPATFEAFRRELRLWYPDGDDRALAYAVRLRVPLVQVPSDDPWGFSSAACFTLADEWLGRPVATDAASPLAMVERYLAAFGPATPADAQAWSGVPGLRAAFEALRPSLVTFRDESRRELFDLPKAPRPGADSPAPVRFLPEYDNLLLAHADRTRVVPPAYRARLTSKNLIVPATFLVDGFVAGLWKVERKKDRATLSLEPFAPVAKKTAAALEEEGDALLRFLGDGEAEAGEVRIARERRSG